MDRQRPCVAPPCTSRPLANARGDSLFGDIGIVTGIVAATDAGNDAGRTLFTDIFAYRDGRWQAIEAQETPIRSLPPR